MYILPANRYQEDLTAHPISHISHISHDERSQDLQGSQGAIELPGLHFGTRLLVSDLMAALAALAALAAPTAVVTDFLLVSYGDGYGMIEN